MTLRANGSYIGFSRAPTTAQGSASGIWDLRTAERQTRAAAWPLPPGNDPDFANVSLLLHMDGTNGSTTFTDSSSNAATVTAVGNAQISTTQSRFGGSSLFVNGGHLTTPRTGDFDFGSGDFTVEMWLYPTGTGGWKTAWSNYDAYGSQATGLFRSTVENAAKWQVMDNGNYASRIQSTPDAVNDQWTFIALVRSGNTLTLYVNGTSTGNKSVSGQTFSGTGNSIFIGTAGDAPTTTQFSGYIDELRITKGVARYTAAFTPPTAAFPDQ